MVVRSLCGCLVFRGFCTHSLGPLTAYAPGANNEHEVNQLKTELCQLKGQMEEMSSNIEKLTSLVNDLMVDKMRREFPEPHKKRKSFSPYGEMDMDVDPAMAGEQHSQTFVP